MPVLADVALKAQRRTPEIAPNAAGKIDYYCVAEEPTVAKLHDHGLDVVRLRDGWYADDIGGGIVILGHGRFLEVRDTPFTRQGDGGAGGDDHAPRADIGQVNLRGAIFGVWRSLGPTAVSINSAWAQ